MAKCFDVVGYIEPCNAVRQKYTGRAMLIFGEIGGGVTFSDNGLKVTGISGVSDFEELRQTIQGQCFAVSIEAENPFGVTVQGNTDSGRVSYNKIIPVSIPATRDGKEEEFIMGLQKGLYANSILVLETFSNDNENDIFGTYSPVRLDPTSVARSEYENGGAWTFNLVCDEPVPNVICTIVNIKQALDTLNA